MPGFLLLVFFLALAAAGAYALAYTDVRKLMRWGRYLGPLLMLGGPAGLAVVTNEVSLMFSTASAALPQIKGKTVRPIAVTSNVRLAALPDVPTFLEAGLTHFDVRDWIGFVVPKGTPIDVRERLHRAFATAFADPELVKRFEENTMVMASPPLAPAAFGEFLAADVAKWAKVIKEAGIQPQ